jgi:hypothetical protein
MHAILVSTLCCGDATLITSTSFDVSPKNTDHLTENTSIPVFKLLFLARITADQIHVCKWNREPAERTIFPEQTQSLADTHLRAPFTAHTVFL